MKLRDFRVRGFRCIQDSGLVPVGDLVALIGKNENGKTALLQALLHLNKDLPIKRLDLCDEMWEVFERSKDLRIVEGTFELSASERKAIMDDVVGAPELKTLHVFRTADGPVQYEFSEDSAFGSRLDLDQTTSATFQKEVQALKTLVEPLTKPAEQNPGILEEQSTELKEVWTALASPEGLGKDGLSKSLEKLQSLVQGAIKSTVTLTPQMKKVNDSAGRLFKSVSIRSEVEKYVRDKLHPRFVYFSVYKQIMGNIQISQFLETDSTPEVEQLDTGEPLDKRETIENLFYLAGLDPEELEKIKKSPAQKNKYLGECSDRLTKALRPTWLTQPIDVELVYDHGDVLWVKVADLLEDGRRTNRGPLSRRAAGFIWHFSFFVNFTAETRRAELKDAILLLDEPGLHLHPAQQAGTLDVLKELAKTNQIVYTTHSPFMIFDYSVGNLLTVELDRQTHLSTIRSTYWDSDPETLIPILHSLGAPEAFARASRAIQKRKVLVIEGLTDYQYMVALIDLAASKGKKIPQSLTTINFLQANGAPAIGPLALYHKRRGKEVVVLYDKEPGAQKLAEELRKGGFQEDKICFCRVNNKPECDIEDLFTEAEYLAAVNKLYLEVLKDSKYAEVTGDHVKAKKQAVTSLVRIVPILESIWEDHVSDGWGRFDKKKVCETLCDLIFDNNDFISTKTMDRFATLLGDLDKALTPPSPEPKEQVAEAVAEESPKPKSKTSK